MSTVVKHEKEIQKIAESHVVEKSGVPSNHIKLSLIQRNGIFYKYHYYLKKTPTNSLRDKNFTVTLTAMGIIVDMYTN